MTKEYSDFLMRQFSRFLNANFQSLSGTADFATVREHHTLYLYFQWTDETYDWRYNLDFAQEPYRDQATSWKAHRGFIRAWKDIEPHIKNEIMDTDIKKIIIVGYSQGAAIATLAHEYVWFNRPDLRKSLEGYGFGCPRVFHGKLTDDLAARWETFYPILNKNDIVTHLPPRVFGFKHVGKPIYIDSKCKTFLFWLDSHMENEYRKAIINAVNE